MNEEHSRSQTTQNTHQNSEQRRQPAQRPGHGQESLASVAHSHQQEISQREAEIATFHEKWQSELEIIYAREIEKTETISTLESEIQGLKQDLEARQAGDITRKDPREEFQSQLIGKIHNLIQRVRRKENAVKFCERRVGRQSSSWTLDNQAIDGAMGAISFELESILLGHNTETSLLASGAISNTDLASLIRSYLHLVGAPSNDQSSIENFVSNCDMLHLIRILTVVALRDWVFQTAFPDFIPKNSPFLQSMRRNVMAFSKLFLKKTALRIAHKTD